MTQAKTQERGVKHGQTTHSGDKRVWWPQYTTGGEQTTLRHSVDKTTADDEVVREAKAM